MKKRIASMFLVATILTSTIPVAFAEDAQVIKGVVTCSSSLNVRNNPKTTSTKVGSIKNGTQVEILETTMTSGHKWGRVDQGWICMDYVTVATGSTTQTSTGSQAQTPSVPSGASVSGVVTNTDRVNVRSAAGVANKLVTTLTRGTKVNIYDLAEANGKNWCQTDQGWICMDYIQVVNGMPSGGSASDSKPSVTPESKPEATQTSNTGTVISNTNLNVREAPGVSNKLVTSLRTGTVVTVLEKTVVKGVSWGKIDKGWICLDYVKFGSASTDNGNTGSAGNLVIGNGSTQIGYTGTIVNCSNGVNIRSAAGIGNALVGVAKLGSTVTILDMTTVKGTNWGKIDKGWICMDYVKLGSMSVIPNAPSTPSTTPDSGTQKPEETVTGNAVVVCNTTVNVREAAGVSQKLVTTLKNGTVINVHEQTDVKGVSWGRIDQGWICMQYVKMNASGSTENPGTTNPGNAGSTGTTVTPGTTGTASGTEEIEVMTSIPDGAIAIGFASQNLDVYKSAALGSEKVGSIAKLNFMAIYETKLSGGVSWARTDKGWVVLSYVAVTAVGNSSEGELGHVANTYGGVNVRTSPAFNGTQLCKIAAASPVRIYEQKNGYGRTDLGWVSMQYITLGAIPDGEFAN